MPRALALLAVGLSAVAAERTHVVFLAADDEYRSEHSLPMLARILEARHGMRTSVAYARPTPQTSNHMEGLEALRSADLAVFFLRWRALPEEQMRRILDFVASGKPLAGLRTTTHAFRYPKGHPHEAWNDGFGRDVFGQKWIRHAGHPSSTEVTVAAGAEHHPILRGVDRAFPVHSWLYLVSPLAGDSRPLLIGRALNASPKQDMEPQPVAWTKTYNGARVFFTTLGHPQDFHVPAMRRMVVNGILWALGREIPEGGANVEFAREYNPPPSGVPPAK